MAHLETTEQALRNRGVSRRDFMKFCALTAVAMGLGPGADLAIAQALSTKPRVPVLWINGLSCSCCTESFLRTAHPLATDIVLSMITMDYQDTIMAAAGDQANAAYEEAIKKYKGQYILAVEGNVPLNGQGMYCIDAGKPFYEKLKERRGACQGPCGLGNLRLMGLRAGGSPQPHGRYPAAQALSQQTADQGSRLPGHP
jgi:hydrogenase (NiFe) small subunit (hydA)